MSSRAVYTGGTFDLFHPGHIELLKHCRKLAGESGVVVVALNTDKFIEKFKGKLPVMSYDERKQMLLACKYVDFVIPNIGEKDSKKTVVMLKKDLDISVDLVVIGSDWHGRDYLKQMSFTWEWLAGRGISITYVPRITTDSTTNIKARFK